MQDGEEHRSFEIEAEAAVADGVATVGDAPEALEDQCGPDDPGGGAIGVTLAGLVMGGQDRGILGEAGVGAKEAVEGIDDLLADLGARTLPFDELEVGALAVGFGAREHGRKPYHDKRRNFFLEVTTKEGNKSV